MKETGLNELIPEIGERFYVGMCCSLGLDFFDCKELCEDAKNKGLYDEISVLILKKEIEEI